MSARLAAALFVAVAAGCSVFSDQASAEPSEARAVVELFTSQGCSSCPPADRLLKTYVERDDVIALSFPVDYWDYLGWPDTFASPMNTERQRTYARRRGDGAVYTPQMVVNGIAHLVGSKQGDIDAAIQSYVDARGGGLDVPLQLTSNGADLVVKAGAARREIATDSMMFWIFAVQRSGTVEIHRGENSGKTITYFNVVRGFTPVGSWDGSPTVLRVAKSSVAKPHADQYLVVLQRSSTGEICGASWLAGSS